MKYNFRESNTRRKHSKSFRCERNDKIAGGQKASLLLDRKSWLQWIFSISRSVSRSADTAHNGPNARSKLHAALDGMCAQKTQSQFSRGELSLGKIEDQSLWKLRWRDDEDASTIRSCSLVNRHRPRIPWLLFQRHFRFTIVLSRIYRSEFRGVDTPVRQDPRARTNIVFAEGFIRMIRIRHERVTS